MGGDKKSKSPEPEPIQMEAKKETPVIEERRQNVFRTQGGIAGDVVTEGQTKKRTLFGN